MDQSANYKTGLLTWISILVTHIGFCKAAKAQNIGADMFPYRSPFGAIGSWIALVFLSILILTKSFDVFIVQFDYQTFIVGYIGLPVYLCLLFGYKIVYKTKRVNASEADFVTGVPQISAAEELEQHRARLLEEESKLTGVAGKFALFYRKVLSRVF